MTLDEYRKLFVAVAMALVLIAASPTLGYVLTLPGGERFSELWVLGPGHMAENYPFNVEVGREYGLFVGVGCHMGGSTYYAVYVKFRNETQPLPDISAKVASPLPPLYEFQVLILNGLTWESQVNFTILDAYKLGNSTFVRLLSVNGVVFEVNSTASWNSEYGGFFYQLFFELWMYDTAVSSFRYHDRFVGLWLNMTV